MNIAIVDDEKIMREQIRNLIEKQKAGAYPAVCAPDVYETGEQLLAAQKNYDIVFLDIQMEGMNGIETAKMIRKRNEETILIFVTGIKEYVFEAFDVAAFHYLLKPIEEGKFAEVFERAVTEADNSKKRGQEQFFIKTRNRNITLQRGDVLYVENRGRKVEVHTTMGVIEVYAVMSKLEEQLGSKFYRCHRGYLVNMAYIAEYNSDSIHLSNGETIYLAKERYPEFVKVYMRYLRNGGTACV